MKQIYRSTQHFKRLAVIGEPCIEAAAIAIAVVGSLQQGCAEPVLRPEFRAAAVRLLTRAGYDVHFAPFAYRKGSKNSILYTTRRD